MRHDQRREKGELAEARSKRREEGEGRISQGSSSLDHETISRDDATPHKQLLVNKQTNKQMDKQKRGIELIERWMRRKYVRRTERARRRRKLSKFPLKGY